MANKGLFQRLKRLFSTDIIIRNVGGNKISVIDSHKIQSSGQLETNSLIDRFNKIYRSTSPTSLYGSQFNYNYQFLRPQLYSEYDVMDQDAIIASALDIISDECTLKNDFGEILSIRSSDTNVQDILYNLFYDTLNIDFNLWPWIRQMCKYGDFFLKLEIAEKYGIYNIIPYTAYHIERQEGYNRDNPTEVRYRLAPDGLANTSTGMYNTPHHQQYDDKTSIYFDNYEMAHFRLIGDTNYLPYGRSYVEPARKLFKQYTLMEDAMLIHRIARAPEKRIYYINVGAIPPHEVDAFMEKTISNMKRTPYVDKNTGDYNLKYNMQNMMEDFYIPIRGNDSATKIETTKGLEYDGIQDVEYLREKLFAALKIPKAFLGYDEHTEGKATLAAEDIRFARTIERIQRIVVSELTKIALVHLYVQGFRDENLTNFELSMQTPSIIFEQERVELLKSKAELATSLISDNIMSTDWVYDNIFNLSEDEYEENRNLIIEDAHREFRISQIANEGNDPKKSGKSFGTPHDLASLYGRERLKNDPGAVPDGYDEEKPMGRPVDTITKRNKQEDNFAKDRLGVNRMKDKDKNEGDSINPKPRGGALALESLRKKNKIMLESLDKKMYGKKDEDLLNEEQLINE